jgi:hypothetical protein
MSDPLRRCNSQSATRHFIEVMGLYWRQVQAHTQQFCTQMETSRDQFPPKKQMLQHSRTHSLAYANQWWLLQLLFQ